MFLHPQANEGPKEISKQLFFVCAVHLFGTAAFQSLFTPCVYLNVDYDAVKLRASNAF